jgi:hypothetical protein
METACLLSRREVDRSKVNQDAEIIFAGAFLSHGRELGAV